MTLTERKVLLHLAGRHRNHAVNPGRVREISPASSGWELRLEPPVNKVLSVSRRSLDSLLEAYRPARR